MKTFIDYAYEYLEKASNVPFENVFNYVKKNMLKEWEQKFPQSNIEDVCNEKRGELYTVMSVDGRFVRDNQKTWSLSEKYTVSELRQLKINIGENDVDVDDSLDEEVEIEE